MMSLKRPLQLSDYDFSSITWDTVLVAAKISLEGPTAQVIKETDRENANLHQLLAGKDWAENFFQRVLAPSDYKKIHSALCSVRTSVGSKRAKYEENHTLFDKLLRYESPDHLSHFSLSKDLGECARLKALKTAKVVNLPATGEGSLTKMNEEGGIGAIMLGDELDFVESVDSLLPKTLFIRDFYPRLFNLLRESGYSILLGNPGISKSLFQWYMIYCLVNEEVPLGNNSRPEVIIRQVGMETMTFYFPQYDQAYSTVPQSRLLSLRNPKTAVYLFEPSTSLIEPFISNIQTTITCSPDRKRYHEFAKKGAGKFYMPCWNLAELQVVGAHVAAHCDRDLREYFTPEAIEKRFDRFGGIFRYVIPSNKCALFEAGRAQDSVLERTKAVHVFVPGIDIEKTDETKENISHFILQYKVHYGGENKGKEDEFRHFNMAVASGVVRRKFMDHLSDTELYEMAGSLRLMFLEGRTKVPELLEIVVFNSLPRKIFKWQVYKNRKWVDHEWEFDQKEILEKGKEDVQNMKPDVLYCPVDQKFPLVDFLFVKETQTGKQKKQVFCIQVTLARHHDKAVSVYEKFFNRLGMDKEKDEVHVYVVPRPQYADDYAERQDFEFFKPRPKNKRAPFEIQFAVVKSEFQQ